MATQANVTALWQQVLGRLKLQHGVGLPNAASVDEQIGQYRARLDAAPRDPDLYLALAQCYVSLDRYDDALDTLRTAMEKCRAQPMLHHSYLTALLESGRTGEALEAAAEARRKLPWDLSLKFRNAMMLPIVYDSEAEIDFFRDRFLTGVTDFARQIPLDTLEGARRARSAITSDTAFYVPYQGRDALELLRPYAGLVQRVMAANFPDWVRPVPMPSAGAGTRPRIGFISACFNSHSVSKTHGGWLKCLGETCDVYGYYVGVKADASTEQIRQYCREFRHFPFDFEQTCRSILADNLHVAVFADIGMHSWTTQLAALRLAPVQCNTWGHPVTSGLPTVDYYFSSELMEPPDGQNHYSEELIRLSGTGIYYEEPQLPRQAPTKTRQDFGLREDSTVFLCCQSLFKYLPRHDRMLARIAARVDNAQFAFVSPNASLARKFLDRLERAFAAEGVDFRERCVILPKLDSVSYWNLNSLSDVFLDSLVWSGCNTTLEAIACGLPVVTCPGEFMRGRHSYAILKAMGVEETIADDEGGYVELAVRLATDPAWRSRIAALMAQNRKRLYSDRACVADLEKFFARVVNAPGGG